MDECFEMRVVDRPGCCRKAILIVINRHRSVYEMLPRISSYVARHQQDLLMHLNKENKTMSQIAFLRRIVMKLYP